MRILIASEIFFPHVSGVAVTVERQARFLAARGHQVIVTTASPDYRFHRLEQDGYTVYQFPSWINPFRPSLRFTIFPLRYMHRRFMDFKPEIVHLHDPVAICRTAGFWAHQKHVPVVFTKHFMFDYILAYIPKLKWIAPYLEKRLKNNFFHFYNRCSLITVPSMTTKQYLLAHEKIEVPVEVLSNGVEVERFATPSGTDQLATFKLKEDLPTVTYIGRIDPDKNLGVLLNALAIVQKAQAMQVVMVGKGVSVAKLKELARHLRLRNVTWITCLSSRSSALVQLYQQADIFCIPSAIETESMVTMEAMATGLPIVAANGGALPELVADQKSGFLVDPQDVQAWAAAITRLINEPTLRAKMGKAGQTQIAARDITKTIDRLEKFYVSLIKS